MKTTRIIAFAALLLSAGCDLLGDGVYLGSSRGRDPHDPCDAADTRNVGKETQPSVISDTVVYMTAVVYPDGYDWQRDTASGHSGARIVLFRNGVQTVSIPVGDGRATGDPDLHHIIDGHLYTENIGYPGTSIWRDGEKVCSFDAREYLKGIVWIGDDIHTLSAPCGGDGYSLRCNGTGVILRNSGSVFGDFTDPSYGETGALRIVDGKTCFAARPESGNSVYVVRGDVEERKEFSYKVHDVKVSGDKVVEACTDGSPQSWSEGTRIWLQGEEIWQCGPVGVGTSAERQLAVARDRNRSIVVMLADATPYMSDGHLAAVSWSQSGMVKVAVSGISYNRVLEGSWRYISDKCAVLVGETLFLALSPMDPSVHPALMVGDRITPLPVNGFATEIRVKINQSCL